MKKFHVNQIFLITIQIISPVKISRYFKLGENCSFSQQGSLTEISLCHFCILMVPHNHTTSKSYKYSLRKAHLSRDIYFKSFFKKPKKNTELF